jgi:hypothetical protein
VHENKFFKSLLVFSKLIPVSLPQEFWNEILNEVLNEILNEWE